MNVAGTSATLRRCRENNDQARAYILCVRLLVIRNDRLHMQHRRYGLVSRVWSTARRSVVTKLPLRIRSLLRRERVDDRWI